MEMKTKIIATIGPATLNFDTFQKLVDEGIDFIRINCSYGDKNQYNTILKNLDDARKTKDISVLLDIKKLEHLQYAKDNNLKYIALSFAEYEEQITRVRNILEDAIVISKIESNIGVENFNSILEKSDGIMVARGDLGEAVSLEKVPPLQKDFTIKTLRQNKFLVTATEMLLSMINNPTPTRAEVSDVANAVFDFSSAVMLSEETTIGKYPVESVSYMRKIIGEAEEWNESNKKKP